MLWLPPRRLRSSWVYLSITSFGILASVTLMAVGAVYSRALAEGGLRHSLATAFPTTLNLQVIVRNRPLGPADYETLVPVVEEIIEARLGYIMDDTQRYGQVVSDVPLVDTMGQGPPDQGAAIGQPFFLTDFEKHAQIVDGEWPQAPPRLHDKGLDLEVVMGRRAALSMGIGVDSTVYLIPFRSDPTERIALTVAGLAEPIDPREEYWMDISSTYFSVQGVEQEFVPIYVPEEAFFSGLGTRYPYLVANYGWMLFTDTSVLTASTVEPTKQAVTGLEIDVNKRYPRTWVFTGLGRTLEDFQTDLKHAKVPLFLFISLVVVVILFFLALVMGLLARVLSDEASLLRSRGASMLQVTGVLAIGEGTLVLVAVALGPFLALVTVRYLLLPTINPAGEGGPLSVGLAPDMFIMGAIGGLLGLAVLLAYGVGIGRLGMVEFLRARARPPTVPLLQRYYVDVLVLAAIGLVWWQIQGRGGFIGRDLLDRTLEVDPSLLLGPVLVLLGAAFLVLRFLPLFAKAGVWAVRHRAPAWANFALTRIARDPLPHGSLAIILMLAIAIGIFGATFQSTLARSAKEQVLYETGSDLVIRTPFPFFARSELESIPGVQTVSPISRNLVSVVGGASRSPSLLIAVNPETLPQTLWFREDFASSDLDGLLKPLRTTQATPQATVLPRQADKIGLWVNTAKLSRARPNRPLSLWMRLSDVDGRYFSFDLGDLPAPRSGTMSTQAVGQDTPESPERVWTYLEAPLPEGGIFATRPPFSVVSIFVSGDDLSGLEPGSIDLDDITVKGPTMPPEGIIVDGFENPGSWAPMPNTNPEPDSLILSGRAAHSGAKGLTFSWEESAVGIPPGIIIPPGNFPLPAIGGPSFEVGQQVRIMSERNVVPLLVKDVTNYFPTVDPNLQPFLMVSFDDYQQYVRRTPKGDLRLARELLVSLDENADRTETKRLIVQRMPGFSQVLDQGPQVDLAQRNPLAGGGWNGLTILSTSALIVAVVLALGTYAAVSVHTGRVDLTVIRALGFSSRQILMSLALERILVAVFAVAAGTALGIWLGRWVLGYLDITATGRPVVPPMIVTAHDGVMALVFVELLVALTVAILFATLAARKLRPSDILRTG